MAKKKVLETKTVNLYSIYDISAEEYGPIFEAVNDKTAMRSFKLSFLTNQPEIIQQDYVLYNCGKRDIKSCKIDQYDLYIVDEKSIFNGEENG